MRYWFIRLALTGIVGGSVLVSDRSSLIVEITRFQLERFIKELAEWFGLELARIVVHEYLAQRRN